MNVEIKSLHIILKRTLDITYTHTKKLNYTIKIVSHDSIHLAATEAESSSSSSSSLHKSALHTTAPRVHCCHWELLCLHLPGLHPCLSSCRHTCWSCKLQCRNQTLLESLHFICMASSQIQGSCVAEPNVVSAINTAITTIVTTNHTWIQTREGLMSI